jgi:dTDP-4-amino-4,6-dideoxy-D-glucose transaminase
LDPDSVARAITPKTRAILAVDLYGIVSPYARLKELAASHNVKLLVDSAPALGAREYGKNIGVQGDAHSFSFHATKAFSTMEGSRYFVIVGK